MTLTGMNKHVSVLEHAGLVTTQKVGRVRTCRLGLRFLQEESAWIERYRQLWDARFQELDGVVEELRRKEKIDGRKKGMHELYPSKEALDEAIGGMVDGMPETFGQLDELLVTLGANVGQA